MANQKTKNQGMSPKQLKRALLIAVCCVVVFVAVLGGVYALSHINAKSRPKCPASIDSPRRLVIIAPANTPHIFIIP